MNYNYIVPVVYNPEDNSSYIGKQTIFIKDCSVFGRINEECNGYNFNRCPNDDSYCQPFIFGDLIYKQFAFDWQLYTSIEFQIINLATGLESTDFGYNNTIGYPTSPASNTQFWSIAIDTTNTSGVSPTCWYLKVKLFKGEGEDAEFDLITTEPYCEVRCNEDTLLITGEYPAYDCEGNYYGDISGSPGIYKSSIRVRGTVEPVGYEFDKVIAGQQTNKSKQRNRFILFIEKVPYYVAQQVAIAFNSKTTTIGGVIYKGTIQLNKNFEEGSEWIIKEEIFTECDEINFTCE